MLSMSCVRSLPARPTNGMPCLSSSAPGPSPTNTRSAWGSPSPNTTWVRPWVARGHFVHASASRSSSSNDGNGGGSTSRDTPDGTSSLGDRVSDRVHDGVGGTHPQAVEVGVDLAGGERERQVTVEACVRRVERATHRVMGGLGDQMALELGEAGGPRHPDQRGVLALLEREGLREGRRV